MGNFSDVAVIKKIDKPKWKHEAKGKVKKKRDIMDIGEAFLAMCEEELN